MSADQSSLPGEWTFDRVARSVVSAQMLFSAGNVLTTGGFLYYYASDAFTTTAFQFAVLLVLPELAATAGLLSRPIILRTGSRKRTWLGSLLLARLFALGVPLTAIPLLLTGESWPFGVLVGWVAVWNVLQGVAYTAYISWLSDLVPKHRWGQLFARRKIATLAIMVIVPVIAGLLKRRWDQSLPGDQKLIVYVVVFLSGTVLVLMSILPLLRLPDVPMRESPKRDPSSRTFAMLRAAWADPSFRWLLMHSWWLSFFQGLTQAPFYRYSVYVLHVPVEIYYVMSGLMLTLQMPFTWQGGRLSDAGRDRATLFWSVTAVSGAMLFWLAATPDRWWLLFGAYAVWGLFGFANICGRNLTLKLAPASDNAMHLSLFRQVGGLFTAIAGLLGGLWLDMLLNAERDSPSATPLSIGRVDLNAFQVIFLVSFLGRATAGLWLLPLRDRRRGTAPTDKGHDSPRGVSAK